MKVAIWGSYNHGNFGDDVMAIQFAEAIKRYGGSPVVYRLNPALAATYEIETARTLDQLFEGASFGIIGGGMMLGEGSLLRFLARPHARSFEQDFICLLAASRNHRCPIYPLSIGGDGSGQLRSMSRWRRQFFSSGCCQMATVRLEEDVDLLEKLGKRALHFPDVLLGASYIWPMYTPIQRAPGIINVGINLIARTGKRLFDKLIVQAKASSGIVFHFINSHLPTSGSAYELLPDSLHENIRIHRYEDPKATTHFIAGLDLLISSKLHLGVTALSFDVPFLSFSGKGKTLSFLHSIDGADSIYPAGSEDRVMEVIKGLERNSNTLPKPNSPLLQSLKTESLGHFTTLQGLVERCMKD